jgi:hypothetical protein
MKRIAIAAIALALVITALPAQEDITKNPGYVDLSGIQIPDNAGDVTEVTIGPELFAMLNNFADDSDKKDLPPPGSVFSINVKSFEIDDTQFETVKAEMQKIEKKLQKENWTPIVRVKSGEETTNVSVKFDKESKKTLGFLVMSLEDGEASFVNLVGSIPFESLKNLGVHMNEDALDSLKHVMQP